MRKLTVATLAASGISLVSLGLATRAGLALVVDPVSGAKHCVDTLAVFLGLQSFGLGGHIADIASFAWLASAPLALLGAVAMIIRKRRSHRQSG